MDMRKNGIIVYIDLYLLLFQLSNNIIDSSVVQLILACWVYYKLHFGPCPLHEELCDYIGTISFIVLHLMLPTRRSRTLQGGNKVILDL